MPKSSTSEFSYFIQPYRFYLIFDLPFNLLLAIKCNVSFKGGIFLFENIILIRVNTHSGVNRIFFSRIRMYYSLVFFFDKLRERALNEKSNNLNKRITNERG